MDLAPAPPHTRKEGGDGFLVIGWSANSPDYVSEIEVRHQLAQIAGDIGLTFNITGVQERSVGQRMIVADFENLAALPDAILDAEVTATIDWGVCDAMRTHSIREMLPFGLP